MAALRCTHCDLDLPARTQHKTCPLCRRATWLHDGTPDGDWQERVEKAEKSESKIELAFLYPHPADAEVRVYQGRKGTPGNWVVHQDLIDLGYRHLEDFSVVYVNGTFFELQDHSLASWRIIGHHKSGGLWRIEPVRFDLEGDTFPEEWADLYYGGKGLRKLIETDETPEEETGPATPGTP